MPFVENDHMVEQIAAAVADPTLGNAILPRTSKAGSLGLDAEALHGVDHFFIEAVRRDQRSDSRAQSRMGMPRAIAEQPKRWSDAWSHCSEEFVAGHAQ